MNKTTRTLAGMAKKTLQRFGYDLKYYHSFYDSVMRPRNIQTIIDIGANNGAFAMNMRQRFPDALIYSFEPLHDCYEELIQAMSGDAKFKSWNVALGDENSTKEIQRSSFNPSSSFLTMADLHKKLYPKSSTITSEVVEQNRLDTIAGEMRLQKNIMVKIDVQGFEDKVIKGGRETLSKCDILLIETSFVALYENQPLFDDIYAMVRALGFRYYGNSEQHFSRLTDELIYEDSIFIKEKS